MMLSDTIGDMITRIRNAQRASLAYVDVPYSKHRVNVLDVLKSEGYILNYVIEDISAGIKSLCVELRYSRKGKPAIEIIERVSKPGRRVYTSYSEIPKLFGGHGFYILSTSKGILTNIEAQNSKLGGEILFSIF